MYITKFTYFEQLQEDPVFIALNNLKREKQVKKSYFDLVRFLLQGDLNLKDYVVTKIIQQTNKKLGLLSQFHEPLQSFQSLCLDNDLELIRTLLNINYDKMAGAAGDKKELLKNLANRPSVANPMIIAYGKIIDKGATVDAFHEMMKLMGIGQFALMPGYIVKSHETTKAISFQGVQRIQSLDWDDIYLYDKQKEDLYKNTEAFVEGKPYQNVLLVGASGTGKSTSVKAVVSMFTDRKLRLIQLQKGQLVMLPKVLDALKDTGFKYVIFLDDLSFEANEDEYKFLKSFIEGSINDDVSHIAFYVTSNRRHMIKEIRSERENDIHLNDFIQEMTSLSDRFGLTITYQPLEQKEYFTIINKMAEKEGLTMTQEELENYARIYAMRHGKRSGRVARQAVNQLLIE